MSIRSKLSAVLVFAVLVAPAGSISQTNKSTAPRNQSGTKRTAGKKSTKPKPSRTRRTRLSASEIKRLSRMSHAFVASATLKPMAKQLLENRSAAAYKGVESYAAKHAGTDEGAMANLVLGYARILDKEFSQALPYLKKAERKSGDLSDYVSYFAALAYNGMQNREQSLATLSDFQEKYPDSVFARDAAVLYVNTLIENNEAEKAIRVAQAFRNPPRAEVELILGRAYLKMGEKQKATEILRRLYYSMPTSAEAASAEADLKSVGALPGSYGERKIRVELLFKAGRYRDAATEYRDILNSAPPADRDSMQVAMAIAEYRGGDSRGARKDLEDLKVSGEANARRLYFLTDIARDEGDEKAFNELVDKIRKETPTSSWLEQALISGGNMYLLKKEYDRAIDYYRELEQRFPTGRWGHYAHWKAAWLSLRQGRTDEARKGFEDQVSRYPGSSEVSAALYWRGRLAEDDKDVPLARTYYKKIVSRFPNYYYADRARERLKLVGNGTVRHVALLDHIPPMNSSIPEVAEAPANDLRVQKAHLLENCGMFDFAVKELQQSKSKNLDWTAGEIARLYQESGGYHRALNYMKRTVPGYFSMNYSALPRNYWEMLFPRPFWDDLKRYSSANGLDPYLVASLIRQESEFNPGAVSRANALGLMQVLPTTGQKLAREARLGKFKPELLLAPNTNMQLGTRYFKQLLDRFNGTPEYALAAYNAGASRVQSWLQDGNFRDPQEFVESIPFTETREYVQAILRNATVYKKLYTAP